MLYIATDIGLPVSSTPEIQVDAVEPDHAAVRQWFSKPEIRFVGAHTGCSCGFPSVVAEEPIEYYDGFFDETEDREKDLASVRALFALMDDVLSRSEMIELFPLWAGDEAEPPDGVIQTSRSELDPERFFFMEHFLYQVTR
jgi:hypothetical protein